MSTKGNAPQHGAQAQCTGRHGNESARFTQPSGYLVSVAARRCSALDPEVLAVLLGRSIPLFGGGGLGPVGREGVVVAVGDGAAVGKLLDVKTKAYRLKPSFYRVFWMTILTVILGNYHYRKCFGGTAILYLYSGERPNDHRQATRGTRSILKPFILSPTYPQSESYTCELYYQLS